ncbi:Imm48 family immunity protein [Paenibacillus sp. NPDC058174]|uniref:Imm48 family immunity protein n=1 Tax=Paenibacillus sp. NPDC058174 TaxID=3346366 RepID=UPI0036DD04F5
MSNFFELTNVDKQRIEEAKNEIVLIADQLFVLIGKRFKDTTELERQVLATFCFGMVNTIVLIKELNQIQTHAVIISCLTSVFKYSEDQAEDFTQELINSTDEEYHPVMFSIIRRGISGYQQYVNNQKDQLKSNILEVLAIVNKK